MYSNLDSYSSKLITEEDNEEISSFTKSQEKSTLSSYSSNTLTTSDETNTEKSILENLSCNSIDSMMFSSLNSDKNDSNSLIVCDDGNFYANDYTSKFKTIKQLTPDEDPWLASSIGVKCYNYKPVGYVFLTRRLLDLYMTDGQRKVEIVYNYSKKSKKKMKIPSIGSSILNCSFCDTVTIDFDPCANLFDFIMEVQIITQGASLERQLKIRKKKHKETTPVEKLMPTESKIETTNENSSSDEDELVYFTSNYDFIKHKKNSDLTSNTNEIRNDSNEKRTDNKESNYKLSLLNS